MRKLLTVILLSLGAISFSQERIVFEKAEIKMDSGVIENGYLTIYGRIIIPYNIPETPEPAVNVKPRLIVLADPNIDPRKETDDKMSIVRLMAYANMFDIEGLIATCSHNLSARYTEPFLDAIEAYEGALSNLRVHADGWPEPEYLRSVTKLGPADFGAVYALSNNLSEGAYLILDALEREDDRPIWITVWGDGAVIAQALNYIMRTEGMNAATKAASKIRVLDNAGQDDSGAWLKGQFPDLFYVRWIRGSYAMDVASDELTQWFPECGECAKGEGDYTTDEWVDENIQSHGLLGAQYPDRRWLKEGDSPTMLYLMSNGLGSPEHPWYGSWGGRMDREQQEGIRSVVNLDARDDVFFESSFDPYYMYGFGEDTWDGYTSKYATIFRWWDAFQNDFAARMDWSITPSYENANHPPVVTVDKDEVTANPGEVITVNYSATDPDGDDLGYEWWIYEEAGSYEGNVYIGGVMNAEIHVPNDASGKDIHAILTVRDNGTPQLTRYHRVVIHVN
jgi:hypothetical protein